jgi:hypothetical protein
MPSAKPSTFAYSAPGKIRLYSTDELLKMPPPTWMVQDVLPANGLIGLFGPPGVGKSFGALDLALCVASGTPWHGKATIPGFVLYVSAEGTAGLGKRVMAWLETQDQDVDGPDIAWVTEAVPIYSDSEPLEVLFERFTEIGREPDFIILDTLARCFEGDENQQLDMGRFVAGVDRFRHECKATVLVVHHTNVNADRERGSTALRGAADTMIRLVPGFMGAEKGAKCAYRPPQGEFSVICDKQKDAECFPLGLGTLIPVPAVKSCAVKIQWLTAKEEAAL